MKNFKCGFPSVQIELEFFHQCISVRHHNLAWMFYLNKVNLYIFILHTAARVTLFVLPFKVQFHIIFLPFSNRMEICHFHVCFNCQVKWKFHFGLALSLPNQDKSCEILDATLKPTNRWAVRQNTAENAVWPVIDIGHQLLKTELCLFDDVIN